MEQEVIVFGLASTSDPRGQSGLRGDGCSRRGRASATACTREDLALVRRALRSATPTTRTSASRENLLFGTPRQPGVPARQPRRAIPRSSALLRDVGLLDDLYAAGAKVAGLMVELFADVPPDSPHVRPVQLHQRRRPAGIPRCCSRRSPTRAWTPSTDEEKARLLGLTFRIVVAQHRLGVIDDERAAQDRRGAGRIPPPLHGPRRHRRVLRARPLQLHALDPGQHPLRAGCVRAGERAGPRQRAGARSRGRGRHEAGARCDSASTTRWATAGRGCRTRSGSGWRSPAAS